MQNVENTKKIIYIDSITFWFTYIYRAKAPLWAFYSFRELRADRPIQDDYSFRELRADRPVQDDYSFQALQAIGPSGLTSFFKNKKMSLSITISTSHYIHYITQLSGYVVLDHWTPTSITTGVRQGWVRAGEGASGHYSSWKRNGKFQGAYPQQERS